MTEEEAKTKWCPFARVVTTVGGRPLLNQPVINRTQDYKGEGDAVGPCIASSCMAWHWSEKKHQQWADSHHPENHPPPEGEGWELMGGSPTTLSWHWQRLTPDRNGFCGLAGAPGAPQ